MTPLPIDYVFPDSEQRSLRAALHRLTSNPYSNYASFDQELDAGVRPECAEGFYNFCVEARARDQYEYPYVVLQNCPIDDELPILDFDNPVIDKRNRKKTYASEGFLLLYAKWMQQEPVGYINVNDGDIFQDIHPMRKLAQSQSQKALQDIYFHKDLANHYVRPDWVNLLGLRSNPLNDVYTTFVRNKDILEYLPAHTLAILREPEFYTPFDDLTMYGGRKVMGEADNHPVLGGATDYDIRLFENRTAGLNPRAQAALDDLFRALHHLKRSIRILAGDFIGCANNEAIHNKQVGTIRDQAALQNRWLMKTVNVKSLAQHQHMMMEGQPRTVNG